MLVDSINSAQSATLCCTANKSTDITDTVCLNAHLPLGAEQRAYPQAAHGPMGGHLQLVTACPPSMPVTQIQWQQQKDWWWSASQAGSVMIMSVQH